MSSDSAHIIDALHRQPVFRRVLDNGLVLLHRPDFSSEVVSVQVWVRTGSIHEDALLGSGLSHYLEHLLFKGTARREGKAISREVHGMGGGINAYTSFDRTVYYIDAPAAAFAGALDVLADIVPHSALPEAEVERERDVILREIDMGLDDPDRRLGQALFRTAFQRHPYREPVIGHRELFRRVTREELLTYYHSRYVPNNMVVCVAGAVPPEECLAQVEAAFGSVPRGRLAPVRIEDEPVQLASRREEGTGDFQVFRGALGYKVPHLSHPDSPRLDALAHALGGGESSLLWEELRNRRQLVHYIDCRNWNPGGQGLFWISYVCAPENGAEAEAAIRELVAGVTETGFDEAAVDKARRQALSAEINGRKTMSGQAGRLGLGEVVIGDIHYARRYLSRLEAVGPGDLREVAARYLVDEGLSCATLAPETAGNLTPTAIAVPERPPFETVELPGGVRLLLQEDHRLPKVHLRAVLRGGAFFEPAEKRGLTALLAELLTKDTARRTAAEVAALVEGIGGSFSTDAGNNTLLLSIEVLPGDLGLACEILGDALCRPAFAAATFETERQAQIAELKEEDDEILEHGFRLLRERFFGAHPLAVSAGGRIGDLEAVTRDDVAGHWRDLVRGPNLVLAACGDFEREALLDGLRETVCAELPSGPFEEDRDRAWAGPEGPVDAIGTMEREQAVVLCAFPDVGLKHEHEVRSELLNELFSGMSSRLFETVRDDLGMAYYVGSTRVIGLRDGMFAFYAGTHPDQAGEVVKAIDGEIARVAAGDVLEDELERCRTRLKAARAMGRQTIGARALHAALQLTYGLPLDDDEDFARKLDATDAAALAEHVREFFGQSRRVRLVVGPGKRAEINDSK